MRSFIAGVRHVERLGADDARDDRVAGDPVATALHRERLRQPEDPRLRRRVARLAEAAERARDRRHVHDSPPAALLHVRPHGLRAVEARRVRLTRRSRSQSSGLWSWNWPTWSSVPALLTRMSTEPSSSTVRATAAATCSRSVTSQRSGERAPAQPADLLDRLLRVHEALRARDRRERAPAVRLLGELGLDEDVGDRDVRASAGERERVRAPEPREPPVTRATRPERSISSATRAKSYADAAGRRRRCDGSGSRNAAPASSGVICSRPPRGRARAARGRRALGALHATDSVDRLPVGSRAHERR